MADVRDLKWLAVATLALSLCACEDRKPATAATDAARSVDTPVAASASPGASAVGASPQDGERGTSGAESPPSQAASGAVAGSAASAGPGSDPAASRALSGAPVEARLTHNYVLARDGEYGYEAADKQRIVMVRYLGEKRGVYTAEIQKGDAVGQMSCRAPCDQILTRYFVGGKQTRAEKTRNDGVSIGAAIFADAMAGQLRTYGEQSAAR